MEEKKDYLVIWYNDAGDQVAAMQAIGVTREHAHELALDQAPIEAAEHAVAQMSFMASRESAYISVSVNLAGPGVPSAAIRAVLKTMVARLTTHIEETFTSALKVQLVQLCMRNGFAPCVLAEWKEWSETDLVDVEIKTR